MKAPSIGILLTTYNDIFSDFDPNHYLERTLSDDFIAQAKKITENKSGNKMSLKFFLPADKRNMLEEKAIVAGLSSFFDSLYNQLKLTLRKAIKTGVLLTIAGIILMLAASYLSYTMQDKYHLHFMLVLFEPAGWFMLWMGLDHLIYASKNTKKELAFYSKMRNSEIVFCDYSQEHLTDITNAR